MLERGGEEERGSVLAGVGGERWAMLEAVCERLEGSALALATSAWLMEGWPLMNERDEVRDQIWRAWRRQPGGGAMYEAMQGFDGLSRELVRQGEARGGQPPGELWRAHVVAAHAWAWHVCRRQEAGFERVSMEVCDGVSAPERFSPPAPGRRAANTVDVVRWVVMGGRARLEQVRGHEAGHWVARASVHVRVGQFVNYSGELCHKLARELAMSR